MRARGSGSRKQRRRGLRFTTELEIEKSARQEGAETARRRNGDGEMRKGDTNSDRDERDTRCRRETN